MKNDLTSMAKEVYENAVDKGFHPKEQSDDTFIESMCNNLHDEVSELHEAWRNGKLHARCDKNINLSYLEEELADILIRVLDNAVHLGVDIDRTVRIKHEYNKTRPYRHGNKKS